MKTSLLLLALALAACGREPSTPPGELPAGTMPAPAAAPASDPAPLLGRYHWQLESAGDARGRRDAALFVDATHPLQLDFDEGRLAVSNTCNRMSASYVLQGDRLRPGKLASTLMACADPARMALDEAVARRLDGPLTLTVDTAGDAPVLTLRGVDGSVMRLHGVPTATTRYGSEGQTLFLEVAAAARPCPHPLIAGAQCLQVREVHYDERGLKSGEPGPWQNLYDGIEGYRHQPGIRNVLRVKRYAVKDPPADGAAQAYVLDMVVESEDTTR